MIMKRTTNMKRSMNIKRDNKTMNWIWKEPWIHDYENNHTEKEAWIYDYEEQNMNMKIEVQQNMNTKKAMNTDEDFWLVIQKYMMYSGYCLGGYVVQASLTTLW